MALYREYWLCAISHGFVLALLTFLGNVAAQSSQVYLSLSYLRMVWSGRNQTHAPRMVNHKEGRGIE